MDAYQSGARIAALEDENRALRVRLENLIDAATVAEQACDLLIPSKLVHAERSAEERDADEALGWLRAAIAVAKEAPQ